MAEERLTEIREERLRKRQELLDQGQAPYPAEAKRTHSVAELLASFQQLSDGQVPVTIVGRVMALRRHGGLVFADIRDGSDTCQLQFTRDDMVADLFNRLELLDTGDFIEAAGKPIYTKTGVPTVAVAEFHLLTKAISPLPSTWYGLKDHEKRFRQREVDVLLNDEARQTLEMRSRIITWLREYLRADGYLEVETPVLQPLASGAAARPFVTHHNTLDTDLYLRIAAEMYLKRLLVSGFEKVFEIERRFRNEGVDRQHNPEFTMLESQWAYADYEDLMDFTETVLEKLCTDLLGTTDITYQETVLSFAKPFKRVRYIDLINERLGIDILKNKDPKSYVPIFEREGLELPDVQTYYHMVDELYKELIRPTIIQPTMLYDYPIEMAPLAKPNATDPRVGEKFQLLAVGLELNNCYTEQNDPVLQREILQQQLGDREQGDKEAHQIDEEYLRAMEQGMPPNAGWSLGVDRFTMLLTNAPSIRDTIAFPLLKPER